MLPGTVIQQPTIIPKSPSHLSDEQNAIEPAQENRPKVGKTLVKGKLENLKT